MRKQLSSLPISGTLHLSLQGLFLTQGHTSSPASPLGSVFVLSHVWLLATPQTVACQAALSMEISRQEYCSGLPPEKISQILSYTVWHNTQKSSRQAVGERDVGTLGVQPSLVSLWHDRWQLKIVYLGLSITVESTCISLSLTFIIRGS